MPFLQLNVGVTHDSKRNGIIETVCPYIPSCLLACCTFAISMFVAFSQFLIACKIYTISNDQVFINLFIIIIQAVLYDMIIKNYEKLIKPRSSNTSSLY